MDPRSIRRDRREHPRIVVHPPLVAHLVPEHLPLVVVDLGTGGFRAESAEPLVAGQAHACEIRTSAGRAVQVMATVVYCRLGAKSFDVGFAFDKTHRPTAAAACALVEQTALALKFD